MRLKTNTIARQLDVCTLVNSVCCISNPELPERINGQRMIKVKARGNETIDQMLKRFKKMCEKEGLTKDVKRKSYYEKPSERRRRRQRKSAQKVTTGF